MPRDYRRQGSLTERPGGITTRVMLSAFNLTPKQLRQAADLRERIDRLEKELTAILTPGPAAPVTQAPPRARVARRRRSMSKAARARQSEMMKKRWAKAKASGRKSL